MQFLEPAFAMASIELDTDGSLARHCQLEDFYLKSGLLLVKPFLRALGRPTIGKVRQDLEINSLYGKLWEEMEFVLVGPALATPATPDWPLFLFETIHVIVFKVRLAV